MGRRGKAVWWESGIEGGFSSGLLGVHDSSGGGERGCGHGCGRG